MLCHIFFLFFFFAQNRPLPTCTTITGPVCIHGKNSIVIISYLYIIIRCVEINNLLTIDFLYQQRPLVFSCSYTFKKQLQLKKILSFFMFNPKKRNYEKLSEVSTVLQDSQVDCLTGRNGYDCLCSEKDAQGNLLTLSRTVNHLVTRNPLNTCVTYTHSDNVKQLVAVFRRDRTERSTLYTFLCSCSPLSANVLINFPIFSSNCIQLRSRLIVFCPY